MEGTGLDALAAVNAELLVNREHALGIFGYGLGFTGLGTLPALHTGGDLDFIWVILTRPNVNTGQILCRGV
jgi:hypothetical protein